MEDFALYIVNSPMLDKLSSSLTLFKIGCATWLIMNNEPALHDGNDCYEENNTLIYFLLGVCGLIIQMDN